MSMPFFSSTEQVSKADVKTIEISCKNDMITCFEILSYASNMLPYSSNIIIYLMPFTYIVMLLFHLFLFQHNHYVCVMTLLSHSTHLVIS